MKILIKALFAILLSISMLACGTSEESQPQEEEILPDSVDMDGMVMELQACLQAGNQICEIGLPFVQIGAAFSSLDFSQWPEATIEDQILSTEDFVWLERTVNLSSGSLVIDGEVFDKDEASDSLLLGSFIVRLRVESDLFHTSDDIKVGSRVEQLKQLHDKLDFAVIPIPDYESISIVSEKTRLAYLIQDKGNQMSQATSELAIDQIAPETEIYAIVVM